MTTISRQLVNTIDYIHGSLLIYYMYDVINLIELAHLVTVALHNIYFIDITIVSKYKSKSFS